MKKNKVIISVVLVLIAVLCLCGLKDNPYHVESIIDNEHGIDVQYPRTGNEKLDSKIKAYVDGEIDEHSKKEGDWLLNMSFKSFYSPFEIIRVKTSYEKKDGGHHKKRTTRKYFFGTKPKNKHISENNVFNEKQKEEQNLTEAPAQTTEQAAKQQNQEGSSPASVAKERKIDKNKKLIALTFDDGPGDYTEQIIDVFNANDSKATFCVLGSRAALHRGTVKQMYLTGHEVANHSYSHKKLTSLKPQAMREEIKKTQDVVYEITGEYPTFLRPTYGAVNDSVRQTAEMPLLLWNVDTLDWKTKNADYVYNHVVSNAKNGDIILFHDIYPTTLEAIKRIVPYLNENGYQLVTVSELLDAKGVKIENGKSYFSAGQKK